VRTLLLRALGELIGALPVYSWVGPYEITLNSVAAHQLEVSPEWLSSGCRFDNLLSIHRDNIVQRGLADLTSRTRLVDDQAIPDHHREDPDAAHDKPGSADAMAIRPQIRQ
jgi:hypothetical protein